MRVRKLAVGFFLLVVFFVAHSVRAMGSAGYLINWDSINSGGGDTGSSTNNRLMDTVGEQATGASTSSHYNIDAGYRTADIDVVALQFLLGTQQNATQTSYSSFSNALKTVTVNSVNSFSTGNLIVVVEDEGLSEKIAVGKIVEINGTTITVDQWDGSSGLIGAVPAGGDDFVYRAGGSAADLGSVNAGNAKTAVTATHIATNARNGFSLSVLSDGNLRTSSLSIANVLDGAVTSGVEEYGARVFGGSATSTGSDFRLMVTARTIQESLTATSTQGIAVEYKLSTASSTAGGSYSHTVYYVLTANF